MNDPIVSVIITSFNRADLLRDAIRSVLEQDYPDFEIVIVDDGSTDHSLEVVESFRKKFPEQIRLFTHDDPANRGILETHLLGIEKARGEFVAFLDNDDSWTSNYLSSKVTILRKHPEVGVVYSPYKVVGEGWFGRDMVLRQWLLRSRIRLKRPFDNFSNLLQFNNVATFSCFVTRKSLLDRLPEPPQETLLYDWWVLTQLSMESLYYQDIDSLTQWRWSRQSTMGQQAYSELKELACRFMELMYSQIGSQVEGMTSNHRKIFTRFQGLLPWFLNFYREPGLVNFSRFLRRSPSWAMASLLSLIINYFKFR